MSRLAGRRSSLVRGSATPWLLYGAGTTARLAGLVLTGHMGNLGDPGADLSSATWYHQALTDANLACPLAMAVAALRLFREQAHGARFALAVLFAAEVAEAALPDRRAGS
jgi:hypothetical protein